MYRTLDVPLRWRGGGPAPRPRLTFVFRPTDVSDVVRGKEGPGWSCAELLLPSPLVQFSGALGTGTPSARPRARLPPDCPFVVWEWPSILSFVTLANPLSGAPDPSALRHPRRLRPHPSTQAQRCGRPAPPDPNPCEAARSQRLSPSEGASRRCLPHPSSDGRARDSPFSGAVCIVRSSFMADCSFCPRGREAPAPPAKTASLKQSIVYHIFFWMHKALVFLVVQLCVLVTGSSVFRHRLHTGRVSCAVCGRCAKWG